MPICCIIYGSTSEKLIANFSFAAVNQSNPLVQRAIEKWEDDMIDKCVQFAVIGIFSWILGYIQVALVTMGGQNLVHNLKKQAFKCFLRLESYQNAAICFPFKMLHRSIVLVVHTFGF